MSENKKIRNARHIVFDGIEFKSVTEKTLYRALKELGHNPVYEGMTFTYWTGPRPKTHFYDRNNSTRHNQLNMTKLVDMKYTPDFTFYYKDILVIIEAKGFENDQFPIRKKLFRAYLDTLTEPIVYAEIFTKRQLLEFLHTIEDDYEQIITDQKKWKAQI